MRNFPPCGTNATAERTTLSSGARDRHANGRDVAIGREPGGGLVFVPEIMLAHRAPGLEAVTGAVLCREFVSIAGPHRHPVKEALGVPVEIAQPFGLQAIGDRERAGRILQTISNLINMLCVISR